jgi:phage terminase Nu1 subunit (DNA packaging protein)
MSNHAELEALIEEKRHLVRMLCDALSDVRAGESAQSALEATRVMLAAARAELARVQHGDRRQRQERRFHYFDADSVKQDVYVCPHERCQMRHPDRRDVENGACSHDWEIHEGQRFCLICGETGAA